MNTIRALEYAKRIAYSTEETLMFTYEMAKKYADSPGCYVECGCAAGAQIIAMAAGAPNKIIHAFDSFEGIPYPSNRDDQMPGIRMLTKEEQEKLPNPGEVILKSTGATSVPLEDFLNHIHESGIRTDRVTWHRGWFQDTTAGIPKGHNMDPIQILRLDGDLYESTLVCLENLYHLVAPGGIVIIDDWQLPGCKAAVEDYIHDVNLHSHYIVFPKIQFVSNIAYWIKP